LNERHHAHSMARLVDSPRATVPVTSMGFSMQDRELHRLQVTTGMQLRIPRGNKTDEIGRLVTVASAGIGRGSEFTVRLPTPAE